MECINGLFAMITIFLDMDGLLVDIVSAVAGLYGMTAEKVYLRWEPGFYEIAEGVSHFNIPKEEIWPKVAAQPAEFWGDMKPYPWAKELYEECQKIAPTYFLTAPIRCPACLAGKLQWIYRFAGEGSTNYIMTKHKHFCAAPGRVLVDDSEKNCFAFDQAGGHSILFPARWNRLHPIANDPRKIEKILKEIRGQG